MYTQRQASQIKQEFWTTFGHYMMPVPNANGEKANWINYKTGNRFIHVKSDAGSETAFIAIEIHLPKNVLHQLYVEQFLRQQKLFQSLAGEDWNWQSSDFPETNKSTVIISKKITGASIFDKGCWPVLISFFKQSITGFDAFWEMAKYGFDDLQV
jgi:Domain of unknown function (DUF4268)